jgi:hypothetical protein
MSVLVLLALTPLGLLAVMGMSWLEDHLLPPPGTPPAYPDLTAPALGTPAAPVAPVEMPDEFPASRSGTAPPTSSGPSHYLTATGEEQQHAHTAPGNL